MKNALRIKDLSFQVDDPDRSFRLSVPDLLLTEGSALGLTGASGTGKTMLLEVLGLLRRIDSSSRYAILVNGTEIDLVKSWSSRRKGPAWMRAKHFGFVPQSGGLLPFLTVRENVALSQKMAGRNNAKWLSHLFEALNIDGLEELLPGALSMGQRPRVALARALAHKPLFVIADEPTAALDPAAAELAMSLLFSAAQDNKSAVIVSSHDVNLLDKFPIDRARLNVQIDADKQHLESKLSRIVTGS